MGLLTPSPSINYNFVAGVYAFCAVLSVFLWVLQQYTDAVEGFYIVLAPFIPCFVWSWLVRQRWLQERHEAGKEQAKTESKKDQ
ncbi:hypothetical protein Poli38472_002710 [Pythium oligandrum]|uniref:Uncharacterized protein n=1 Tax=Pythium oligandrum TaxID=41045 RepID=A0A8K1CIP0_PYTOL|nr:hypothetical protein Poli38472_002710 [Pythium oligandrum]|eukprot:TMW63769.1 hypothetical protein Poli38472_002710 [Pythium oligandrum]